MKKIGALVLGLFVMISFSACFIYFTGDGDGGWYTGGTTTKPNSSVYKQITSSAKIDFSSDANSSSEFYMFMYNTSDKELADKYYKYIFKSIADSAQAQRSVLGQNELNSQGTTPTAHTTDEYNCGLSLFSGKALPSLESVNARSVLSATYERDKNKAAAEVGDQDYFYATKSDKTNVDFIATCRYVDEFCQIFVQGEKDDYTYYNSRTSDYCIQSNQSLLGKTAVTKKGVEYIAGCFAKIYKAEQNLLGDVDLDTLSYPNIIKTSDRITILIADLEVLPDKTATLGYFYSGDLYCNECDKDGNPLYSNQRLMFTLNTEGFSSGFGKEQLASTLGHEFNHMINFIQKVLYSGNDAAKVLNTEAWFTEMLSAITEDFTPKYMNITNTVQKSRIPRFLYGTKYGMYDWKDLYSYGFAYAFGAYLVRNYGGAKLVREMATNKTYGKQAITDALKSCGYDEKFDDVLQKFGLVLVNADGRDTKNPTLKKDGTSSYGYYSYQFTPVDLYSYDAKLPDGESISEYCNPRWSGSNRKGPCFYRVIDVYDNSGKPISYITYPNSLAAGAFYTVYLGKASEWNYWLQFNPPTNSNIKAYIYLRN